MVAAEAAAAGVLPISAAHSGALEVSRALAEPCRTRSHRWSRSRSATGARAIAERLNVWLGLDAGHARRPASAARDLHPAVELGGRGAAP